jgi:hypothetical protein
VTVDAYLAICIDVYPNYTKTLDRPSDTPIQKRAFGPKNSGKSEILLRISGCLLILPRTLSALFASLRVCMFALFRSCECLFSFWHRCYFFGFSCGSSHLLPFRGGLSAHLLRLVRQLLFLVCFFSFDLIRSIDDRKFSKSAGFLRR